MKWSKLTAILGLAVMLLVQCAMGVNAAVVKTDLLGGLGDFEFSADTSWQRAASPTWTWGVKEATDDDSVAPGWLRLTDYNVVPEVNTIYKIEQGTGINGSNSQYFALKGLTSGSNYAVLMYPVKVQDDKSYEVHHGDQVTFRIDQLSMTNFANLPRGASVSYKMIILCQPSSGNAYTTKILTPSTTASSGEVTATVTTGTKVVYLYVQIQTTGGLGTRAPGIRVDGAHLYIKRSSSSSYATEEVPVSANRNIKTQMLFFRSESYDPYEIAKDYDSVTLQYESEYRYALRLKYYNPSIQVLLYEAAGGVTDWRDENLVDPWYSNTPIKFTYAISSHPDWFYPMSDGFTLPDGYTDNRQSWRKDVNYLFDLDYQNGYYVHLDNKEYQEEWAASTADKATRYHLDGVFCDGVIAMSGVYKNLLNQKYSEPQSFEHGAYPVLRDAGLTIVQDSCTNHLNSMPGIIYFHPTWSPSSSYPASQGYEANNPETTPDVFFQEWAFFKHWPTNGVDQNRYELSYWLNCLNDMDRVAAWNKTLPKNLQKYVYMLVHGVDRSSDPATGDNGWANFGLCSYLIAQNNYTYLGIDYANNSYTPVDIDWSITKKLGAPSVSRKILTKDQSVQLRNFTNGFVVVNAHPSNSYTVKLATTPITTLTLKPHTGRIVLIR